MRFNKFNIAILVMILFFGSCTEDYMQDMEKGYLRVNIGTNEYLDVQSRIIDEYNPKQIALTIINSKGETVMSTDDASTLTGNQIELFAGDYTINASSYGFDGNESGFDVPYYAGSKNVTVERGKEVTAEIECFLANVKVTVNYDPTFVETFTSATAEISSGKEGVNPISFVMGQELKSGYFPVADLNAKISVTNKAGEEFSQDTPIKNVKARKHYILNYKVAESGTINGVDVSIDDTETVYTFTFNVSTEASTKLAIDQANAFSNFAYLQGYVLSASETLDDSKMSIEYKESASETWLKAETILSENKYKATVSGLTSSTEYNYRLNYVDGAKTYTSIEGTFTTEAAKVLPNGNMDSWYKSGKTWYPVSESDYNVSGSFWDSSNPGTTTGAGALVNKNPTQGSSTTVHTAGGQSAELKSQYASAFGIGKFAAGSLYTGKFNSLVDTNGAKIDFGQKFSSRPSGLKGWFHYTNGKIDYRGENTPAGVAEKGSDDLCSIYIAIARQPHQLDNTKISTFFDFENDPNIIAYGSMPDSEAVSTNGSWKEFNVKLTYKDITPLDEYYLIIVCSSSKYGDYFTGSTGSTMYIDDMELIYDELPIVK